MSVWPSLCVYQPMHTHKDTHTPRRHTHIPTTHTHPTTRTCTHTDHTPHHIHMNTHQTSYTQRHTSNTHKGISTPHTHTYAYSGKRTLVCRWSHLLFLHHFRNKTITNMKKKLRTRMGSMKDQGKKNTKLHFVKVLMILELCNLIGLKLFTWERTKRETFLYWK